MTRRTGALAALLLVACSATAQLGTTPLAAPTVGQTSQSAVNSLNAEQNPFLGSTPVGKPTAEVLNLTILDALDRGLKTNLGIILTQQGSAQARAALLRARAAQLPRITADTTETVQQLNLVALGLPANAGLPPIVGPFSVFDIRAFASQSLFNLHDIETTRAARETSQAAQFTYQNARDLVVLVVGGSYLQTIASAARVDAAQSQFVTAKALYDRAVNLKSAGVVPGIDVLRAQVQMQAQQQRLLAAQNDFEKQKLTLGRTIGLPPGQQFRLADTIPFAPPPVLTLDAALARAYEMRGDYKSAQATVRAAELTYKAAGAQRLPTLSVGGNYGDQGKTPAASHGTFMAAATLSMSIFDGGRIRSDEQQAQSRLTTARSQAEDLRARIEYDLRSAFLDMNSSYQQVQVAQSALNLAKEQVAQAQDRFSAGVTNNIEVVQAQDALAVTNENYIASLFAFNFSKLSLARAMGVAEEATKRYLGGK